MFSWSVPQRGQEIRNLSLAHVLKELVHAESEIFKAQVCMKHEKKKMGLDEEKIIEADRRKDV